MRYSWAAFVAILLSAVLALESSMEFDSVLELTLDTSGPYIGSDDIHSAGYTGSGVTVAVIDTGVDFTHPDLAGSAGDMDAIVATDGYNFVSPGEPPYDKNGHGTQVAGIIAASGEMAGIAPGARIMSYKVSDDGESVASDLIAMAIQRAVGDVADIINVSLGVNRTNAKIDSAVNDAIENGVVVVVAAGNDGPGPSTIGSPGRNPNAITVGATYNNITSSLVATLEIGHEQYQVIPMLGISAIQEPISTEIVFGKYGRDYDLDGIDAVGSILLVERGSDRDDEIVYFTEKEHNAADAGAAAIVVYNNDPGMYLGDVSESFTIDGYSPRIPIVSLSQEDGIKIRNAVQGGGAAGATLNVFYNPDYVAFFSSRGPASPFYVKPDLVAPGAFINSTDTGSSYNFSSGTSFAAPHVAGAAALLLERHPGLLPSEIKSLLVTTTDPVTDAYGNSFRIADSGSGRLSLSGAFGAELIVDPTFLVMTFSPGESRQNANLSLREIDGAESGDLVEGVRVEIESPGFISTSHRLDGNEIYVDAEILRSEPGDHDGMISIWHGDARYRVPVIFQYVDASIDIQESRGTINFEVTEPKDWKYAKISVISKKTGEFSTTSLTPKRDSAIMVQESGEYWVEGSVIGHDDRTLRAYGTVLVESAGAADIGLSSHTGIPERPIYMTVAIAAMVAVLWVWYASRGRRARLHASRPPVD